MVWVYFSNGVLVFIFEIVIFNVRNEGVKMSGEY